MVAETCGLRDSLPSAPQDGDDIMAQTYRIIVQGTSAIGFPRDAGHRATDAQEIIRLVAAHHRDDRVHIRVVEVE